MSKFRIEGVGIDTTTLEYLPGEDFEFQYIFTSISSNNENIVRDFSKNAALVTYIDFLDKSDEAIISHLGLLDRNIVDLLLVDSKCDFVKYADTLNFCIDSGQVDTIGIMEPESVERIKEIQEVLPNLKYIGLSFCPLNFNYDIISWALENEIDIIGFNPFGGHISSAGIIDSFSVPYLLGFASTYSKLLFLSGRDLFTAADGRDYVSELIDKESNPIYELKKNVNKLYKPLKKTVNVSVKLSPDFTLPIDNPRSIFSPEEVAPKDTESDENRIALLKPRIIDFLELEYPGWNIEFSKIGDRVLVFNLTKIEETKILKRKKTVDTKNYLFSIVSGELDFYEINPEIPQSANNEDLNS